MDGGEEQERPMTSRGSTSSVEVERSPEDDKDLPSGSGKAQNEDVFEEAEGTSKEVAEEVGCSHNLLQQQKKKAGAPIWCPRPAKRRKIVDTRPDEQCLGANETPEERQQRAWASAALYSRACSICSTDSPRQRNVFAGCGHTICRACAVKLTMDAGIRITPACPYCRKESITIRLNEGDADCYDEPSPGGGDEKVREAQDRRRILDEDDEDCEREQLGGCSTSLCTAGSHLCFSRHSWIALRKNLVESYLREEISSTAYTRRYNDKLESESKYREGRGGTRDNVYEEEYRRLNAELPQGASRCRLADCAADVGRRRERKRLIGILKAENEENAFSRRRYSRACPYCPCVAPDQRSVFVACGHIVCRPCAVTIVAGDRSSLACCPFCHKDGEVISLFEDMI